MMVKHGKRGGFTLLEVLVASAILSIIAAMVFGAFNGVFAAGRGVEESSGVYHTARFIIRKMTEDLSSASLLANNPNGRFIGKDSGPGEAQTDEIRFTGFGRRTLFAGSGSDQAEIGWYVISGAQGGRALMRSESSNLLTPAATRKPDEELDVTSRLVSFNVRYLFNGEWRDEFDSVTARALPQAALVEFLIEDGEGRRLAREALIAIGGGA